MHLPLDAGRPGLWTAVALAAHARERPESVAHLGLRTRSTVVEDALALAASDGRLAEELAESPLDDVVVDDGALAGLALLWSGHDDPPRIAQGARVYAWLASHGRLPALPVHHQATAQSLLLSGQHDRLRALLPVLTRIPRAVRHDVEVDLAHPGPDGVVGDDGWRTWEQLLSVRFTDRGLAPLRVRAEGFGPHLFDRLTAQAPVGPGGSTLVTVIVPCWRPDEGLLGSVASLTAQTYPDLEIVVVDDASGPGYDDLFDAVERSDERVHLLRLTRNGGSYLARRAALESARGEVFTTQDADDWSHPQRVEHQLTLLAEHPDAPASRSSAVRAKDDLTHQWFGYRAVRDNASSLMVRRAVLERAGTFLPIRKSADSEYAERLATLVGDVVDTGSPLAVTRLRTGSLSRGDFTYQWSHPDRILFRGSYRAWHRTLDAGGSRTPADADMPEVPPAFARDVPGVPTGPQLFSLAVVADFSTPPGTAQEDPRVRLTVSAGPGPTALWHVEVPAARTTSRPEMHPAWYDLVLSRPDLHLLTRTRRARVGTAVVLDPPALTVAGDQPTDTAVDQVLVALRPEDVDPGDRGTAVHDADAGEPPTDPWPLPVDLLAVSDVCHRWWGVRPQWVGVPGSSPQDQHRLAAALPDLDLMDPVESAAPWTAGAAR